MTARRAFHLHVERSYLRLLTLVAGDRPDPELATRLESTRRAIHDLPAAALPMARLAARLGLDDGQVDFLWTAVALASEPRMMVHAEATDGPAARCGLTVALYCRIAGLRSERGRELAMWLAEDNPLVESGLLVRAGDPLAAATAAPVRPPPRLVAWLAGRDLGEECLDRARPRDDQDLVFDARQRAALVELGHVLANGGDVLVVLEGSGGSGRRTALAHASLRPLAFLREGSVVDGASLTALRRELTLGEATPILEDPDLGANPEIAAAARRRLEQWIDRVPGPVVITAAAWGHALSLRRPTVRVAWPSPDVAVRQELWRRIGAAGGLELTGDLETLAMRHRIGPGGIARALQSARTGRKIGGALGAQDLERGLRHNIAERLGELARRVEVAQTWDDVILPDDTRDQIHALVARVRLGYDVMERWQFRTRAAAGQGVAALFSGAPGTGKTMVAGLIAKELDLALYQVDLSQVVSKWVGETEKQLAKLFAAAEEGHALLLFDEADALFGQRTSDLRGATDRYANLEVNYLLQRIESFSGICILTTNLDATIDKAVKRRLAAHVVFPAPDEDERERLWRVLLSTGAAPLGDDLDFADLAAAFPTMTGANIRNAVLSAAFLARAEDSELISQGHLLRGARGEYRSMGHVLSERPAAPRLVAMGGAHV